MSVCAESEKEREATGRERAAEKARTSNHFLLVPHTFQILPTGSFKKTSPEQTHLQSFEKHDVWPGNGSLMLLKGLLTPSIKI